MIEVYPKTVLKIESLEFKKRKCEEQGIYSPPLSLIIDSKINEAIFDNILLTREVT